MFKNIKKSLRLFNFLSRLFKGNKRLSKFFRACLLLAVVIAVLIYLQAVQDANLNDPIVLEDVAEVTEIPATEAPQIPNEEQTVQSYDQISEVQPYSGTPYAEVNGNVPFFSDEDLTSESFEYYGDLDDLGRCTMTMACIGEDIMPTEERGSIGSVRPSGWHTVKYDIVDGKYLYNRCHLIGYQLAGENANVNNLITGTRYLNVVGMLPFEDQVADYVHGTGNHVLYRVTPVFTGDNLVADGVLMEARSVEDGGEGVTFCVFVYNVQPGIWIDYSTGDSGLE